MNEIFDDIIVGAGSAGCVLANRLSVNGKRRVLLLEAGGEGDSFLVKIPKGMGKLIPDPMHAWQFAVEQSRDAGQPPTEIWARGKMLGGSSSINGMIYVRGQPDDYSNWEAKGATGWGWPTMKAAFKAIEDHELGGNEFRGVGGPVHISTGKFRYPVAEALIKAGEQLGLPRKEDLNTEDQDGVGYYAHTIKNGQRVSAAQAFLKPARHRQNLTVVTQALVDRVLLENQRAVGVEARVNGKAVTFRATGEVILSAGALMSPKILQLSGIGPTELLQSLGINVVCDPTGSRATKEITSASMASDSLKAFCSISCHVQVHWQPGHSKLVPLFAPRLTTPDPMHNSICPPFRWHKGITTRRVGYRSTRNPVSPSMAKF